MATVSGRIVLLTLAGIAAGLLTWLLSDLSGFVYIPDVSRFSDPEVLQKYPNAMRDQTIVGVFFGAMIGLMLGLADMIASGMEAQWARIVGYGLFIGAIAGFVGLSFGGVVYGMFQIENVTNPFAFLVNTLARALGWGFIGALAGAADGVRKWSGRTIRNGVVGGFIGGLLGGTVFEAAVYLFAWVPRPAVVSRLLGFLITGGLIGLFIGLVQQLLKEAWVRIVVGKNEGREVLIDKEQTTIGRSELCDIALFGDRSVEKNHAVIVAAPTGGYVLRDVSGKPGTVLINGAAVQSGEQSPVKGGDTLSIGGKTLLFFERYAKERTVAAKDGGRVVPPIPPAPFPPRRRRERGSFPSYRRLASRKAQRYSCANSPFLSVCGGKGGGGDRRDTGRYNRPSRRTVVSRPLRRGHRARPASRHPATERHSGVAASRTNRARSVITRYRRHRFHERHVCQRAKGHAPVAGRGRHRAYRRDRLSA